MIRECLRHEDGQARLVEDVPGRHVDLFDLRAARVERGKRGLERGDRRRIHERGVDVVVPEHADSQAGDRAVECRRYASVGTSAHSGSEGSCPASTSSISAQSRAVRAIGPT